MDEGVRLLLITAYRRGYQAGHEHTVEGHWSDDPQRAEEAVDEMVEDGSLF